MIFNYKKRWPRKNLPGENLDRKIFSYNTGRDLVGDITFITMASALGYVLTHFLIFLFTKSDQYEPNLTFSGENITDVQFYLDIVLFLEGHPLLSLLVFFILGGVFYWFLSAAYSWAWGRFHGGMHIENMIKGYRGEAVVGNALGMAGRKLWKNYHSVEKIPGVKDIDHILVCERGVFCIETKVTGDKNTKIYFKGEKVWRNDIEIEDKYQPLKQARHHAALLSNEIYIKTKIRRRFFVVPIVVYPYGEFSGGKDECSISVDANNAYILCSVKALQEFVLEQFSAKEKKEKIDKGVPSSIRLTADEVQKVQAFLDEITVR